MRLRFARLLGAILLALPMLLLGPALAGAQPTPDAFWQNADDSRLKAKAARDIVPDRYRTLRLDLPALREHLASAPSEKSYDLSAAGAANELIVSLPLPDGDFARFRVVDAPIMAPGLAAKYPGIRTFRGQGIDDRSASVRFDHTPAGFHAMITSAAGTIYIDPYSRQHTDLYISYWTHELRSGERSFECHVDGGSEHTAAAPTANAANRVQRAASKVDSGDTLRTYRLVVAATGEYTQFHGGTVALGQAAIVTAMNRVNQIYEQEVAIRMVLVANNDLVVYTNGATDPYTNDNGSVMLNQNATNLNSVIGNANFDIGHVFSTGGGGIATLFGPCGANKARGVTGLPAPTGDPFWVDFVAHEMGHQWAGNHTFNGDEGSCAGGNRNAGTAYEPGSGTTIQAYAGICGSQNLQANSDPYFHGISLDEIIGFSAGGGGNNCAVPTATGNDPPTVDAGAAYTIPVDTPFELCGSATDPNSDPLAFAWEQFDLGPAGAPGNPTGNAPIFRSFDPTTSPCRTFPRMADLAAGQLVLGELLPTYARTMTFRLTARDNRSGGGGVSDDETTVTVTDTAGPFQVTAPNTSASLLQGAATTVAWDVASTDQAPVSCGTVNILLSTDGGLTYPTTLAAGVANSGSRSVTLPDMGIPEARIQVRCATGIFFDISDESFGIGVPAVEITAPSTGSTSDIGDVISFSGSATDPEDGDISSDLLWTSSEDGTIGAGGSFDISTLSLGTHTITASVTDSDTNTSEASVTVTVFPTCVDLQYSAGYEADDDGWTDGASTCTTGTFIRGTPDLVQDGGITTQVAGAASGTFAWFTQNNPGGVGTDDVDGGTCETLSPVVSVGAGEVVTVLIDYFHGQRDGGDDPGDGFSIELLDGISNAVLATPVNIGDVVNNAVWTTAWSQTAGSPASVRLRVRATDAVAGGDLVEAGLDNVRICTGLPEGLFEDGFESGNTLVWSNSVP